MVSTTRNVAIRSIMGLLTDFHNPLHDGPLNEVVNFTVQLDSPLRNGGSTGLSIQAQLLVDGRKVAEKRAPLPLGVQEESFNILALTKDGSGMNFLIKKRLGLFHGYFNPVNLISWYISFSFDSSTVSVSVDGEVP